MTEITPILQKLPVYGIHRFKNITRKEVDSIRVICGKLNGDFERRKVDGQDTTFVTKAFKNETNRSWSITVYRLEGALPKRGKRYILPTAKVLCW